MSGAGFRQKNEGGASGAPESNARQIADYYNQYGGGGYGQQYQQQSSAMGDYYSQGGYSGYGFSSNSAMSTFPGDMSNPLDAEIQLVLGEMRGELELLKNAGDYGDQFKNAKRLLAREIENLETTTDPEWLEVDIPKPMKLSKKILIPSFRHPHFNFVGKVLGPRGQTLQSLAKQFKCHVYVLGRGSTKDRNKEQELLSSGDPQYAHYGGPLHVKVETIAPAHIAYMRVAGVLESLCNTLVPVRDELVEQQMAQLNDGSEGSTSSGKETADDGRGSNGSSTADSSSRGGRGRGGAAFRGNAAWRGSSVGGPMRGGPPMRGRGMPMRGGRGGPQGASGFFKRPGAPY